MLSYMNQKHIWKHYLMVNPAQDILLLLQIKKCQIIHPPMSHVIELLFVCILFIFMMGLFCDSSISESEGVTYFNKEKRLVYIRLYINSADILQ